jgi:hypothetical protein
MEYKTFKDLEFKPHPSMGIVGLQALMDFPNGYGISVIQCKVGNHWGSYTNNDEEWECAVLKGDNICYSTPITNDVIGHCDEHGVTDIMKQIQDLPKWTSHTSP